MSFHFLHACLNLDQLNEIISRDIELAACRSAIIVSTVCVQLLDYITDDVLSKRDIDLYSGSENRFVDLSGFRPDRPMEHI